MIEGCGASRRYMRFSRCRRAISRIHPGSWPTAVYILPSVDVEYDRAMSRVRRAIPMSVFKLIFKRFVQQFSRTFLYLVIAPIVLVIALNLFMVLAAYVECWAFGKVTTFTRGFPERAYSCYSGK